MTDPTPRTIEGLERRPQRAVSRLLKSERATETPEQQAAPATPAVPPAAEAKRKSAPRSRTESPKSSGRRPSITSYVDMPLQERARAAFIHTRNAEGDESFSQLVAKAIDAEVSRREALYNGGRPFTGGVGPLPAGRPMQG